VVKDLSEVCPVSRGVTFKPLSIPLQDGIRFFRLPLPAPHSGFLAVALPGFPGGIRAYLVPHK